MVYTRSSLSKQKGARLQGEWRGEMWSAEMFPNEDRFPNEEMFPNEEPSKSHDLTADDTSSTLRATADCFERSASAAADKEKREALLEYAKFYRKMAELRDKSDAEAEDEPM